MERSQTIFCIRYAVNVLERHASFYSKLGYLISFLSLLSGMSAIASVASMNQSLSMIFGLIFAISQALEFSIRPEKISANSIIQAKEYKRIEIGINQKSDKQIEDEYGCACAEDTIVISHFFRKIAENDTVRQFGYGNLNKEGFISKTVSVLT